ncbi:unnamed protein product [Heterobilharzia americana]|nr:unnamed protein product [Heterobilharzia americana]
MGSTFHQINLSGWCGTTGDPTSLWCDESLENPDNMLGHCICYTSTPSSFSTTSGSTSYSRDLYTTSKQRSRSEEKNHKCDDLCDVFHIAINHSPLNRCFKNVSPVYDSRSCPETKLQDGMFKEINDVSEITRQNHKQEEDCKRRKPFRKSCSSFCCSEDSDSVPPAMALINVNRFNTQNLYSVVLNENNNDNNNNKNLTVHSDLNAVSQFSNSKKSFSTSRKSLPAIHLECDLEMSNSSGTSSLSDGAVIVDEIKCIQSDKYPIVLSNEFNSHCLNTLQFGQASASARDSGLSSHSSNSINYSPNSAHFQPKGLIHKYQLSLSPTPPPIPAHAPQSQAMTALVHRNKRDFSNITIPVSCGNDLSRCTCPINPSNRASVNKVNGTTIRLHYHDNEQRICSELKDNQHHKQLDEQNIDSSLSPIWKRKLNSSTMELKPLLTEKLPVVTSSPPIRIENEEGNKRQENLIIDFHHENLVENDKQHNVNHCSLLDNSITEDTCTLCTLNWQFYLSQPSSFPFNKVICSNENNTWYFLKHDYFLKTTIHLYKSDHCYNCRRHIYAVGVNLFNRNPLRGLKFLSKYNFIKLSSSKEISQFLQNNSDLCRSKIGAFLGLPPSEGINPTEVTMILLKSLNISGLEVDEALRLVVHRFGMPVESQEIDRLLQCISEYYHTVRWASTSFTPSKICPNLNSHPVKILPAPITVDQLTLIFYAVLLLQTSLHNVNAAKSSLGKQNVNQFIKNVHDLLFNQPTSSWPSSSTIPNDSDRQESSVNGYCNNTVEARRIFSNRALTEIYHRIKARPLVPGPDQTEIVRHISKAMGNLNELKVFGGESTSNVFELVESHRRLVCYCTVIHIVQNQPPKKETSLLRHLFVFNDLIIIAKDASSKHVCCRRSVFDKSKQRQKSIDNVLSIHCKYDGFLQPPVDLFINNCSEKQKLNTTELKSLTCIQPTVNCVPYGRRSRSKNDMIGRKASNRSQFSRTRLIALFAISLVQCKIRPFKTDVYNYGVEFWSFPKENPLDINPGNLINTGRPEQLVIIAALTKNDYHNLLTDLFQALCETNHVQMEFN